MSSMYPSFGGAPARPCMRCGNPLTLNETQCSRCGTFNPLPQGQQFGAFQQGAQGNAPDASGSAWGSQAQQGSPYQQSGNGAWMGNPNASAWEARGQAGGWPQNGSQNQGSFPSQPLQNNGFGAGFGGQSQGNFPSQPLQNNGFGAGFGGQNQNLFSNGQQNGNQSSFTNNFGASTAQQNGARPSLNSFLQATRQNNYGGGASSIAPNRPARLQRPGERDPDKDGPQKRSPVAIIVVLVLAVLVIAAGGGGAYYYLRHHNSSTASTNTSPTAAVTPIVTPGGKPLFRDLFTDNKAGWDTTKVSGQTVSIANGALTLTTNNHEILQEILPGGKSYPDLEVDVDVGLASGGDPNNGYGIYVRATADQAGVLNTYYRFEIYGDGSFVVYKSVIDSTGKSNARDIGHSNPNNAILHVGSLNHLTVIAKGHMLKMAVNGTTVATITDTSYKSGTVALFASQVTEATSSSAAIFKNLAIFPAP